MPIRSEIPTELENSRNREMEYRVRCGWGGNLMRKLNSAGNVLATAAARSAAASHPISLAHDGYRPHEDPLDPTYGGYWQSTGRPLRPRQFASELAGGYADRMISEDFTGTDETAIASHAVAPTNNINAAWYDANSRFKIVGNALVRNGSPNHNTYIELGASEYDLVARMYIDNAGAYDAGLDVRWLDSSRWLYLQLHSNSAGTVWIRDSGPTILAENTAWTITTGWHIVRVVNTRTRIRVLIDGVEYIDVNTTKYADSTKVGVFCWDGCNPQWDWMRFYRPLRFYESFSNWNNWSLGTFGTVTGQAATVSGLWGKLAVTNSAAPAVGGYSGRLNISRVQDAAVSRDSVFQAQIGVNRIAHAGAAYNEAGVVISDTNTANVSAEVNAVLVSLRSGLDGAVTLRVAKVVGSTYTLLVSQDVQDGDYSENVRIIIKGGILQVYSARYGAVWSNTINWLPADVFFKAYVQTDDSTQALGYFRDLAVFPSRKIYVSGEVGFYHDAETFDSSAWNLTTRFGNATLMSVVDDSGTNAIWVHSAGGEWCCAVQNGGNVHRDFRYTGQFKQKNRTNIYFRCNQASGDYLKGYGVQFETGTARLVKDTTDNGAGWVTTLVENAAAAAAADEVFTVTIQCVGTSIKVWKNGTLIFNTTDSSYSSGFVALQSFDTGFYMYWQKLAPRGLQQPVMLRVDRPMVQNASFEEWDDLDGLTEDGGILANSWKRSLSSSGATARDTGADGTGYSQRINITNPQADPYFQNEIYQRGVRFLNGHRYRVSFQAKVANDGNTADTFERAIALEGDTLDGWDNSQAVLDVDYHPGWIRFRRPSSPPEFSELKTPVQTLDVTKFRKIRFSVTEYQGPNLQWRFGVRTPGGDVWLTSLSTDTGTYSFDMEYDAGLTGSQDVELVFQVTYVGGYPANYSTWICVDYLHLETTDGMIGGYPFLYVKAVKYGAVEMMRQMIQIATPTENLLPNDTWQTFEYDFIASLGEYDGPDDSYLTFNVSAEFPNNATHKPVGDFSVNLDNVMIEDVTGFAVGSEPALAWTESPVTFRGQTSDREESEDYWAAFYTMPLNIIWRLGDEFTWGLLDEDGQDLFTSREYTFLFPGSEWLLSPEWISIDLGMVSTVNQVVFYSLYNAGIRWLLLTHGDSEYVAHLVKRMMDGLAVYSSATRLDLEAEEAVTDRYFQLVILDTDAEGNVATAQEFELYNFANESARIHQQPGASPEVSMTTTRSGDINSLPNATQFNFNLNNHDGRFTPRNQFSPIYGTRQADGLGEIRAGVPVRISMLQRVTAAGGAYRYAMRDECYGYGYWANYYPLSNPVPGIVRMTPPSSPPIPYMVSSAPITLDISKYKNLRMKIAELEDNGGNSPFKFRLGVTIGGDGSYADPGTRYYIDGGELDSIQANVREFSGDIEAATGLTGVQTLRVFIEFTDVTYNPYTFFIGLDYCYIYAIEEAVTTEYETLMLLGTIGVDSNKVGAMGISLAANGVATIEGVDYSVLLDQPTPTDVLDVWESISAEDTMRRLCYLGNIPRQDLLFDATGVTFPTVILRDQTIRENLSQIVQALGGRFFTTPDGRMVYQNVVPYRNWEQSEQADFAAGVATNVDINSVPGEVTIGNIGWDIQDHFAVLPESESDPWTVDDAEPAPRRYISNGRLYVQIPVDRYSLMRMTKRKAFNRTTGFTLEWTMLPEKNVGVFDIWGYTQDVDVLHDWRDRNTANCAWRLRVRRLEYGQVYVSAGGMLNNYIMAPHTDMNLKFVANAEKYRFRITVKDTTMKLWVNNSYIGQVPLCKPSQIRWFEYQEGFQEALGIVDNFTAGFQNLNNHTPDTNKTAGRWYDPNNCWISYNGYCSMWKTVLPSHTVWDDGTSYFDMVDVASYRMAVKIYLDRNTAFCGGIRVRYVDQNNYVLLKFNTSADGSDPNKMLIQPFIINKVDGVESVVQAGAVESVYQGSVLVEVENVSGLLRTYWTPTSGSRRMFANLYHRTFENATKFAFFGVANSFVSYDDLEVTHDESLYFEIQEDDFVGKVVIGPTPAEYAQNKDVLKAWLGQSYRSNYWMDFFRIELSGNYDPINTGNLVSQSHDCTAAVSAWGIFEVDQEDVHYAYAPINYYVAKSSDGVNWDAWEQVMPGQPIPGAVKRYIKWKAVLVWNPNGYTANGFIHWWPKLRTVTINWLVNTTGVVTSFRATYNLNEATAENLPSQEFSGVDYSQGNPTANRIPVQVNKFVAQSLATVWSSNDLPQTINNTATYMAQANYSYPTKKGSGGTLRHCHVTINGTPYTVNDGVVQQVCGSTKVTFTSGQNVGTITILATADSQTISAISVDAVQYKPASELGQEEVVYVEDTLAQAVAKRVIESEPLDNAFAMNRAIALAYGNAYLVKSKQCREGVTGLTIPIKPSISLENHGVVHAPAIGFYERQIVVTEVDHAGFTSTISGEAFSSND